MEVHLEYEPRPHQLEIHKNLKRWNVLVCHRRFGKSVLCINQLIVDCLRCENNNPRFAYIAPLYKQSKAIAWDYLKHFASPIPGVKFNESELRADFPNGGRITLYGADNPDSLRGIYLDGVILDEFAQMSPVTFDEVIRPTLSDRKGYAIFIGTPQGHNTFYRLYNDALQKDDWFARMFRASETNVIDEEELRSAKQGMSKDAFDQEYECSFEAAIRGAVYGAEMKIMREQDRICKLAYDPRLPVFTVHDPGDAHWAIGFFQIKGKEKHWIDSAEIFKPSNEEVFTFLTQEKEYKYSRHYLPFDATVHQKELGKSTVAHLKELGLSNITTLPQQKNINHGIQLVKTLFNDLCISEEMEHAIDCVSLYHYDEDVKRGVFRKKPDHDWTSHIADMLRYFAIALDTEQRLSRPKPQRQQRDLPSWAKRAGVR